MSPIIADKKFLNQKMKQGCSHEGCDCKSSMLYIASGCCGSDPRVAYDSESGAFFFSCAKCNKPIMAVPVAELPEEDSDEINSAQE